MPVLSMNTSKLRCETRADAGGGEVHLLRHGLRVGEQLRHGLDRHVVGDDQRRRRRRKARHRVVLRDRIEVGLRFLVERLADGDRVLRKQQRIAVRIGGGDVVPGEIAAGAGAVLDHHGLAERLLQIVGNLPREGVGGAAGHEGDDEMDRLVGIGALRRRGLDGDEQRVQATASERTNFSMTSSQGRLRLSVCCSLHIFQQPVADEVDAELAVVDLAMLGAAFGLGEDFQVLVLRADALVEFLAPPPAARRGRSRRAGSGSGIRPCRPRLRG